MSLEHEERQAGDVVILDLRGKIKQGDITIRTQVRRFIEEGRTNILLNLDGVTRFDESVLMDIKGTVMPMVERAHGDLRAEFVDNIRNTVELTRLVTLLTCYDNEAEALNSFPLGRCEWKN